MLALLANIPDVGTRALTYVFERALVPRPPGTLWLEFGVASGRTINYISTFTTDTVVGFDTFCGLPEPWRPGFGTGAFTTHGKLPDVRENVQLIKGLFQDTLEPFLATYPGKVSFVHIDCDLYSATKYVLDALKDRLERDCVVVFDELVNYPGFDGPTGELRAFYEFVCENDVAYTWMGMDGDVAGVADKPSEQQAVAVCIHAVRTRAAP